MTSSKVALVECPRDAMQGWKDLISTGDKVEYINALLQVGFDTIDFGSFVSAKAIPQMADTREVIDKIDKKKSASKLLAIIANKRGAEEAASFEKIDLLGFPFSISETFQQRNGNSSIAAAHERLLDIREITGKAGKGLVVYLSMGFGNHYGDPYSEEIVFEWADKINQMDVTLISIADTVGVAEAASISRLCKGLIATLGKAKFGLHLHSRPNNWREKIEAAWLSGCRRFDGALLGIGGCPMADDHLTGNIDMGKMINYFESVNALPTLNREALTASLEMASRIFSKTSTGHNR
ncbi:MAG: hydroxymethylglutaryl-CoA lyase [Chitinophagaceae bacterium]